MQKADGFYIAVDSMDRGISPVYVHPHEHLFNLLNKTDELFNTYPYQKTITFTFNGNKLSLDKTFSDYQIKKGSTVYAKFITTLASSIGVFDQHFNPHSKYLLAEDSSCIVTK